MNNSLNKKTFTTSQCMDTSLESMAKWAPTWTEDVKSLLQDVQSNSILDPKLVCLIRLLIDVTATHLYAAGVQRHIRIALEIGVSRVEILEVFKLASIVGIHACALGVPILEQELNAAGISEDISNCTGKTPICDEMRAQGSFNPLWETIYRWDPMYLERFLKVGTEVWRNGVLPPLWIEFLCIAGDITITHMWAHGAQRHIQAALTLGATREQILELFKIVSLQGIEVCEMGIPLLEDALQHQAH